MTSEGKAVVTPPRHTRKIPAVEDGAWDHFNALRKEFRLSWNDIFKRFMVYENGMRYIFEAPPEMTKPIKLDLNTTMSLIDLWVENMRVNLPTLNASPNINTLREGDPWAGKPGIVIAAGPTLVQKEHLKTLREYHFDGPIVVAGHALAYCLQEEVVPTHAIIVDGDRDKIIKFIDDPLVHQLMDRIKMVFCASVHPDVVKEWTGEKYFFFSGVPQSIIPNVDNLLSKFLPDMPYMDTTGNCGGAAYALAAHMGANPIATIGLDLAYPAGTDHKTTMYWNAYAQSIGAEDGYKDEADLIQKVYHSFHHPVFGTDCYTDFVYEVFADAYLQLTKTFKKLYNITTINATEGGCIHAGHIRSMKFRSFLDRYARRRTITQNWSSKATATGTIRKD